MTRELYYRIFAIKEIEDSKTLQFLFYCITLSFFATFFLWVNREYVSIGTYISGQHICPPYFVTCGKYLFLQGLPYGYSQNFFYVILFLLLGYGIYSAYNKKWLEAHAVILVCLIWKIIWGFFLTYGVTGNFDYYDMVFAFVFVFLREKEYFAKLSFVYLYFLASSIKIHEGWIFGNYFNSLLTGAPFFNASMTPIFTNIVIVMQIAGCWFLLSNNKISQRLSFIYFLLFHIYSGLIVTYRYISIAIPTLFVLFFSQEKFYIKKISKKTLAGYILLISLTVGQLTAITIYGDQKKTLEGNYYGLYMFEANHQCMSKATVYSTDTDQVKEINYENHVSNIRCDLYGQYFRLKTLCERSVNIKGISWTFDHSINGHPYERIVDAPNVCDLEYKSLSHNHWIKVDGEAEILDLPVYKNGFGQRIDDRIKIVTEPIENAELLKSMETIYWSLWYSILITLSMFLIYYTFKKND
jgi:hypothetical protein